LGGFESQPTIQNSREKAQKKTTNGHESEREWARMDPKQNQPQMNPPPLRYGATGADLGGWRL